MTKKANKNTGKKKLPDKLQVWVDTRKRFHLSHAQVQMARELGMNPKKLGKKANHDQEPWKLPLPQFIEHLYQKRFGREQPEVVMPIAKRFQLEQQKKAARRAAKRQAAEEKPQW
jgi:hypothetical protein